MGLRTTINNIAALDNSFLDKDSKAVEQYVMTWAAPRTVRGKRVERTKGLWYGADKQIVRLVLVGVVDLQRSHLGSYGNCYWNRETHDTPWASELGKSKFNLAMTYPVLPPGHTDGDIVTGILNQMYRLDDIENNAVAKIRDEGQAEPEKGTTDWVRFEEAESGTQGWIHVCLGPAFVPTVKRIKVKDIADRAAKTMDTTSKKKDDIEEDPLHYFRDAGRHNLRHNENLPCYKSNGEKMGRTSGELRSELYHGRWVKVEVEMVLWNLKSDDKEIFQLIATRLDALDAPPASMEGIVYEDGDVSPRGRGSETASDGDDKGEGPSNRPDGGSPAKKQKIA